MRRSFPDFEVSLTIKNDHFVAAPRGLQRKWLLQRALNELVDNLRHLDAVSERLVAGADRPAIGNGWDASPAHYDASQLVIEGQQVMQDWERPLMAAMARHVARTHGDVLEVGFGMGISATCIQELGVRSHTIIEANREVMAELERWRDRYPDRDIRLVPGRWQDTVDGLGRFDAVLFDTYPTSEAEFLAHVVQDVAYAEHFFPYAAAHLRPGGAFTYYTNEIDSLNRAHQRRLLEHFRSLTLEVVTGLRPPPDCTYWWADTMAVVEATR
jgi:guanidinoacetate N-methyltransferase